MDHSINMSHEKTKCILVKLYFTHHCYPLCSVGWESTHNSVNVYTYLLDLHGKCLHNLSQPTSLLLLQKQTYVTLEREGGEEGGGREGGRERERERLKITAHK